MTLTAQQPDNNVVRVSLQALAAVLGGCQSLHTNARDEALALPTEDSARLALRTQQVIAFESGVADTVDPLGGAYAVEAATDLLEAEARRLLEGIESRGGALRAIERGEIQQAIQESAYRHQREVESGERVIVGVNRLREEDEEPPSGLLRIDPEVERAQVARVRALRARRDPGPWSAALRAVEDRARSGGEPRPGPGGGHAGLGHRGGDRAGAARRLRGASRDPGAVNRVFRLRVEEAIALFFLVPTFHLTLAANLYAREAGVLGDRHPGGVVRLAVAVAVLLALGLVHRLWPDAPAVRALREVLPFLTCILIYTNLHDTIGFVNPHDVHLYLAELDRDLFGVIPAVWAERFITPGRTEVMSFLYANFFWIAPSTSVILLWRRRWPEFRAATLGVMVCFYLGYFLYLAFPAAPPRLVLVYEFKRNLAGYPQLFSSLSARAFELLPVDSRAAFPSLHAAVSLAAMVYAWRYLRWWFWVLLPFCVGLWASTVYLRHHYVVDLLAGWALAPAAIWLAPRLDAWWARRQQKLGYAGARGAPGFANLPHGRGDGLRVPDPPGG